MPVRPASRRTPADLQAKRDQFVEAAKEIVAHRYPDINDQSYTSIIDEKSYRRLRDARGRGEQGCDAGVPVPGATFNDQLRKIRRTSC